MFLLTQKVLIIFIVLSLHMLTKTNNLAHKIVDKLTKSNKIGISMEFFTTNFWQFSSTDIKISLMGDRLVACYPFYLW